MYGPGMTGMNIEREAVDWMAEDPSGIPDLQHKMKILEHCYSSCLPDMERKEKKGVGIKKEDSPFQLLRVLSKVRRRIRKFGDRRPPKRPCAELGREEATCENTGKTRVGEKKKSFLAVVSTMNWEIL